MIKITKGEFKAINLYFEMTLPSGRKTLEYIEVKLSNQTVNIAALGDVQPEDTKDLIKAIELAAKIATGEIVIS